MRIIKSLVLALLLLAQPVYAMTGHFTVTFFSDLTGQTASTQDTGFTTFDKKWYVYDGANWIDCPNGACALAVKSFCDPQYTTSVGITGATAADQLIVAGVAGKKITSCGGYILAAGTVSVKFVKSSGATCAGTDANISEAVPLIAQVGHILPAGMKTSLGDSFCMNLAQAIAVTGEFIYRQEP